MKEIRWLLPVTLVAMLVALLSPWVFTHPSVFKSTDFTNTGQIGDTVGGLTAPVIGILNAILLYYTIRQQNLQIAQQAWNRHEDNLIALIDRKTDVIRQILSSLKLTIEYADNHESFGIELLEEVRGEYTGIAAIEFMCNIMFNNSEPFLGYYKISNRQWLSFVSSITLAGLEAIIAIEHNYTSGLDKRSKKQNYEYLTAQIIDVIVFYHRMESYKNTFPADPNLVKLDITEKLKYKATLDRITQLDPDPDLRQPEPGNVDNLQ